MVSSQVGIDLIELDTEATNFDLVIGPACDCAVARIVQEMTQVASPVDPVTRAFVILSPWLLDGVGNLVISLNPLLVVDKPVVEELFLSFLGII